jgi:hypothetical protein
MSLPDTSRIGPIFGRRKNPTGYDAQNPASHLKPERLKCRRAIADVHSMPITDYPAIFFAYEFTKRHPSDSVEMLASAVAGTQVDLNPHQADAAQFALQSPLPKGAARTKEIQRQVSEPKARFHEAETAEIDGWADDLKIGLKRRITEFYSQLKALKKSLPKYLVESLFHLARRMN